MVALTGRENVVVATCYTCGESKSLLVNINDVIEWKSGKYIQDAMPYLDSADRELLISGTCGDCFENMFPNEEDF